MKRMNYNDIEDLVRILAVVTDELPKRGLESTIYFVRDNNGIGYHQCVWMKKPHVSIKDWLLRRTHEWVNIGYSKEKLGEFCDIHLPTYSFEYDFIKDWEDELMKRS